MSKFSLRIPLVCVLLELALGLPAPLAVQTNQHHPNKDYHGHQVLRLSLGNHEEWQLTMDHIEELQPRHTIDVWKVTKSGLVDFMVSPRDQPIVHKVLQQRKVPTSVLMHDVGREIKHEKRGNVKERMSWDAYHRVEVIHDWMDEIAAKHKAVASVKSIGLSFEGRPLKVLKLSTAGRPRKKVFLDAGIHAREWIAPAAATYVMKQFLDNYKKHKKLVDSFEWHFLPIFNPDGYEFTHTNWRMWRKTRSTRGHYCAGADANRNFPIHWREGEEAQAYPCAAIYPGVAASSENCVKAFQKYILGITANKRLVAYYSLHAYGQFWLLPNIYNDSKLTNLSHMMEAGQAGVKAIKARSRNEYSVGNFSTLLKYEATGTAADWMYHAARVPYSFTWELSPKIAATTDRNSSDNFILDAGKISEVGEDVIAGLNGSLDVIKKQLNIA